MAPVRCDYNVMPTINQQVHGMTSFSNTSPSALSFSRTNLFAKDSFQDVIESLLFDVHFARFFSDVADTRRAVEHMFLITTAQSLLHHLLNPGLLHLSRILDQLLAAVFI